MEILKRKVLRQIVSKKPKYQRIKKLKQKKPLSLVLRKTLNIKINLIMSVLDKVPISKFEKWLTRIIAIALAAWEAIRNIVEIIGGGA